jgi:hypothetical protein
MRDVRMQVSVTRTEYQKLLYLADASGRSLGAFLYGEIQALLIEYLPAGSEQAYYFDLAQRLKRAGQGHRELNQDDLKERVNEAIEHGHTGKLFSSGDGPTANQSALSDLPTAGNSPLNDGRDGC